MQVKVLREQLDAVHGRLEGRVAALSARSDVDKSWASGLEMRVKELEMELQLAHQAVVDKDRHLTEYKCVPSRS